MRECNQAISITEISQAILRRFRGSTASARFTRGAFWSLAGVLVSQGLTLIASVIVAKQLGAESFGKLGIINSTLGMFGVFAGLGAGMTATRHIAKFRDASAARLAPVIGLAYALAIAAGLLLTATLWICADSLAARMLSAPELGTELRIASVLVFLNTLAGVQTSILAGFESFDLVARLNVIRGLLNFPLLIPGAFFWGLRGAIVAMVASVAAGVWIGQAMLNRRCRGIATRMGSIPTRAELKIFWEFSLPAVLSSVMVAPVSWLAAAWLANRPSGYAELGIFNAANQWRIAVCYVPTILSQVSLPLLSRIHGSSDFGSFRSFLNDNIRIVAFVTLATVLPLCFGSGLIMAIYGPIYANRKLELLLLLGAGFLSAVSLPLGTALTSAGRLWQAFCLNLCWALVFLCCSYWWIPRWLASGLAAAYCVSYLSHGLLSAVFLWGMIGRPFSINSDKPIFLLRGPNHCEAGNE